MHLSIITDEISENLEYALQVCRELQINTIELRKVDGKNIVDHDQSRLLQIKQLLHDGGFHVCSIASPFLKCPLWDRENTTINSRNASTQAQKTEWDSLRRSFEIAHLFAAPHVRTFSFLRTPDPDAARPVVLEAIAEAVRLTENAGLQLVIENEHACNIATGEETGWLLQQIQSPTFGVTWDPGNQAALGSHPYPGGYNAVRGRVLHMHVKDVDRQLKAGQKQGRFVKMGTGSIDYVEQFRALARDGYHGAISLETHYIHPQGGREYATRESLEALRNILSEAGILLK